MKFPEIKSEKDEVLKILKKREANQKTLNAWHEIVKEDLQIENEDDDLIF